MAERAKIGGAERLATAALFVALLAVPLSRAAFQIIPSAPLDSVYFDYHTQILQFLFIVGTWRAGIMRQGASRIPRWSLIAVAVWLAAGFLSAALGELPLVSLVAQARWVMWAVFTWAAFCYFRVRPERRAWALEIFVAGFVGFSLVLHFLIFVNTNPDYSWVNGIPGFANVRHFGFYAMAALAAAMMPLFDADFSWRNRGGRGQLFAVVLCWTMLFWAGGRSPLLAIAVTAAIFAFRGLIPNFVKILKISLIAAVLAVPWSLLIAVPDPSLGLARILGTSKRATLDELSSGRLIIWRKSIEKIADAPLAGVGPGVFPQAMDDKWGDLMHPHNIVIQAFLEWGLLGGVPFLMLLAILALGLLRKGGAGLNRDPPELAGSLVAFSLLATSFLDGSLYHPFPLMVAAIGAALFYGRAKDEAEATLQQTPTSQIPGRLAFVGVSIAVLATLVGVLSVVVLRAPGTPAPDGARVAILRLIPVSMAGVPGIVTYSRWTDEWAADIGGMAVVRHLEWARHFVAGEEPIAILNARQACANGDADKAAEALDILAASRYSFYHREGERIGQKLGSLWPACARLSPAPVDDEESD